MGLDMYFSKQTYVKNWDHLPKEEKFEITVLRGGEPCPNMDTSKISYITEEFGYWRKFNALHKFIVKNFANNNDDCRPIALYEDDLKLIVETLENVHNDHTKAEELLPTESGFFFGGTEYDEWYFKDVENALEVFKKALKQSTEKPHPQFEYRASW